MANLSNQQIRASFPGVLQVPGGITNALQTVQDGNGNPTGLQISSAGIGGATSSTFVASDNGTQITGAVPRLISDGFGDYVSVKDFGAVGDGVANDTTAFENAFSYLQSAGGGQLYVPPGSYKISSDLNPSANTRIYGAGRDASVLLSRGNPLGDRIFVSLNANKSNLTIEGLGFEGNWLTSQSESGANGLVTLTYWTNVLVKDCAFRYAKFFIFNINKCDIVRIEGNICEYSSRDQIAVWNTSNIKIINNTLRHNDDDAISIGTDPGFDNKMECLISGNELEDTGPIRVHGRNVVITQNTIRRPRGAGVSIGLLQINANNIPAGQNIVIANNVITDVMDRQWFVDGTQTGSSNNRAYINLFISGEPYAGALPVPPGEVYATTGTVPNPYGYYYNTGVGTPARAPSGYVISNNICRRTLEPVTNYSDWGFGQAFTKNGFVNYQVPDAILSGVGLKVELPITDLLVKGNLFAPGRYGIRFEVPDTLSDNLAKSFRIVDNSFKDCVISAMDWTPGTATLTSQDIIIDSNEIDCDPFFKAPLRSTNGSWTAEGTPYAFNFPYVSSIVISKNRLRNVNKLVVQTGVSNYQQILENLVFADANAVGFDISNKGVGVIPPVGDGGQWWIQFENSDPTSADYKKSLGANLKNYGGMPSSGTWLVGTQVASREFAVLGTAGSRYVLVGYKRLTTGTAHVLNTDWAEMRTLTGT